MSQVTGNNNINNNNESSRSFEPSSQACQGMTDDNSPPPSSRSTPRSHIFTARRDEGARFREPAPAHLEDASSRPLIQISPADGAPEDEVRLSIGPGLGHMRNLGGRRYTHLGDPPHEPASSLSHCKPRELRSIDSDYNGADAKGSDRSHQLRPAPCTRPKCASLAAATGNSAGFVALASQPRIRKSSSGIVLHPRDRRHWDGSSRSTSQLHSDRARGGAATALSRRSIPVGLHAKVQSAEPDDGPSTKATPRVTQEKRRAAARGDRKDRDAPLNLASTSTRKPHTGSKDEDRTARTRRGLTIDISFAKSTTVGSEGHILKSITTHVESIVARILQRHGEDRQPLSHSAKETAVIQPEGQGSVVVGVKMTEDLKLQEQPKSESVSKSGNASSPSLPPAMLSNVPTTLVEDGTAVDGNVEGTIFTPHQQRQPSSLRMYSPHQKTLRSSTEKLVKTQMGAKPYVAKLQATASKFSDADAKGHTSRKTVQEGSSSSAEKLSSGPKPDKDGATVASEVRMTQLPLKVEKPAKKEAESDNYMLATVLKKATVKEARKLQHENAARKVSDVEPLDLNRWSQDSNRSRTSKVTHELISSTLTKHIRATSAGARVKPIKSASKGHRCSPFDADGSSEACPGKKKSKPEDKLELKPATNLTHNGEKGAPMITGEVKSKVPLHEAKQRSAAEAEEHKMKKIGDFEMSLLSPQLTESTPQETKNVKSAKVSSKASKVSANEAKQPCQVGEREVSRQSDNVQQSTPSIHLDESALQKSEKESHTKATAKVGRVSERDKISQADKNKPKASDELVMLAMDLQNGMSARGKNETPMLSGPKHMKLFPETGELLPSGPLTVEDKMSDALAEDLHATNTGTSEEKPLMSKSAAPHTEKGTTEAGDAHRMPAAERTASMRGLDIDLGKLPLQAALREHATRKPSAQSLHNRHLGQSGKGEDEPWRHAESFKDTKHEMKMAKERKHSWMRAGQDGDYKHESPKASAGGRRPELAVYERGALEVFQAVKAPTAGRLRAGTNVEEIQSETGQSTTRASIGKRKQSADTLSQAKLPSKVDSDIGPSQQISHLSQQQGIARKRSSGTTVAILGKNERDGVSGSAQPSLGTYGWSLTSPQSPDSKIGSPESKPSIVYPGMSTAGEHGTTAADGPSRDQKQKMTKQEIIAQAKLKRAEERAKRSKKKKKRTKSKDSKEKKQKATSKEKKKHRTKHGERNERRGRRDEVGYTTGKSTYIFCIILLGLAIAAVIFLFFLIKAFAGENVPSTWTEPSSSKTSATTSTRITPIYFCQSKYCKREGSYIASLLSHNFEPCDNLYSYVCDAWSQRNPTDSRVTGTVVSRDTQIRDALAAQLISIVRSSKDEDLKSAAALHSSCTTRSEPERINALVKSMFGNWIIKEWPLKTRYSEQPNSVWKFAAELARDLGIGVLLEVTVGVITTAVPGETIVELSRPRFLLDKSEQSLGEVQRVIKGAIEEAFTVVSSYDNENVAREIEMSMVELSKLASASPPRLDDRPEEWISVPLENLDVGVQDFVDKVFEHIISLRSRAEVLLKSPTYIREEIVNFVNTKYPTQVLNYMGFVALVRLAPFFSDALTYLRTLFSRSMLGHSGLDVSDTSSLCFVAVESLLPNCFAKAAALLYPKSTSVAVRNLLSRLETIFANRIEKLEWIGELSALYARYRLRERRVIYFGPHAESCVPPLEGIERSKPLLHYLQLSMSQQQRKLQRVLNYTSALAHPAFDSDLDTEVGFDATRMTVHVPATIVNVSVVTDVQLFAFHAARVATRMYRALVRVVTEEPFGGQLVYKLTANAKQKLEKGLRCVGNDLARASSTFRGSDPSVQKRLRSATLEQAAAIHLAFEAFRELLHVQRIWGYDFRMASLPEISAHQLFFIYLALDNCRSADVVYRKRQDMAASAEYRVNFPLLHLKEFSEAFECRRSPVCEIISRE